MSSGKEKVHRESSCYVGLDSASVSTLGFCKDEHSSKFSHGMWGSGTSYDTYNTPGLLKEFVELGLN